MDKELLGKDLGSEARLDMKLEGGKLKLALKYDGKGIDSELSVSVEPDYFMDKLAAVIPGSIDDAVLAIIKGALKG